MPSIHLAGRFRFHVVAIIVAPVVCSFFLRATNAVADGLVKGPALYRGVAYKGSVEEKSQEAIIIFNSGRSAGEASEDLILKISVAGEVADFAWMVPFPNEPKVEKADKELFAELHNYVEARLVELSGRSYKAEKSANDQPAEAAGGLDMKPVEVLSRRTVGTYDVAVVRENEAGALNDWLQKEGYQSIDNGDDVLEFYREKGYVFACIKVSDAQLSADAPAELHPLRFRFATGGRDGIYFPMKLTGLQSQPFDVNLFVFRSSWINDRLNKFGYEHRGFVRKFRDWDTSRRDPNAGKTYSSPELDPYLKNQARRLNATKKLFQTLHPGERYYLTNIQARNLDPDAVRQWSDDLWMFPYYTNREFVPFDVRSGGPASAAWPNESGAAGGGGSAGGGGAAGFLFAMGPLTALLLFVAAVGVLAAIGAGVVWLIRRRRVGYRHAKP